MTRTTPPARLAEESAQPLFPVRTISRPPRPHFAHQPAPSQTRGARSPGRVRRAWLVTVLRARRSLPLPFLPVKGVLDVAVLVAGDPVRPVRVKHPDQPQAGLLHHAS